MNRSKAQHLNIFHIIGAFINNSLDLINTNRAPLMQLCVTPRPFDLNLFIEHGIVRVVDGLHRFYEPGTATSKTHKRLRTVLEQVKKEAERDDKNTPEWLVSELHDHRGQLETIHLFVSDMTEAINKLTNGDGFSKAAEKKGAKKADVEETKEEEEVEEEISEAESEEQADSDEGSEESPPGTDDEESPAETENEQKKKKKDDGAEEAWLLHLAARTLMEEQRRLKEQGTKGHATPKKKAGASSAPSMKNLKKEPAPAKAEDQKKKRKDPSQGSPDDSTLRSKRMR